MGDVVFCFGKKFIDDQERLGIDKKIIPAGSPLFDDIYKYKNIKPKKQILFLEQHFFPKGKKGKKELALMLLNLAKYNPEYKIIVKPRTIPSEVKNNPTHKAKHLYKYIYKISPILPENLILLTKHKDLIQLIVESEIVGTTFSIIPQEKRQKKFC